MCTKSYFGLDDDNGRSWTLVQWLDGRPVLLDCYTNTIEGLRSLQQYLHERARRPRICIKPNRFLPALLNSLSTIPDAEVILVSDAGLRQYRTWLPTHRPTLIPGPSSSNAAMLARCAVRMI